MLSPIFCLLNQNHLSTNKSIDNYHARGSDLKINLTVKTDLGRI
jgi:hypothetical protein